MKRRKPPAPVRELDVSQMNLEALRKLLKDRGDTGPRYFFSAVEDATNIHDYQYVFWLDLMGARNLMKLSLSRAARSVMKIHAAALFAKQKYPELEINPVMDGVYGFVKTRKSLETCLSEIMTALANVFIQERVESSRFMVRAGVAFGPLISGAALAHGADIFLQNKDYLGGTAIGMAISHAYEAEGFAPPFGVYIHESARAFAPKTEDHGPYRSTLWRWFKKDEALTWATRRTLIDHFDWLGKNPVAAQYGGEPLLRHKALADEYFELHGLLKSSEAK